MMHRPETLEVALPGSTSPLASAWHVLAGVLSLLAPLGLTAWLVSVWPQVAAGEPVALGCDWVPLLGLRFSFLVDGLSLAMGLLVTGVGALVMLYTFGYFDQAAPRAKLQWTLLAFMLSMLGLVLADNLVGLFVFWELTSVTSFLLVGFKNEKAAARAAAIQALLVTGAGGLCLLAGLVLLGLAGGTFDISALLGRGVEVRGHPLYLPALALVLLGAFTKSAQVPFHFWLPGAMAAPSPVSAYLHSATMVKAGVYLLARLSPALSGTDAWHVAVTAVGLATAAYGGWVAWQETDLKRILAYTTIGALGVMVALIGWGTPLAMKAALLFLVGHAFYKGALFLVAGAIEHAAGSRDVRQVRGLWGAAPGLAVAGAAAAISMAGVPPTLGFLAKEVLYDALLGQAWWNYVAGGLMIAANAGFCAAAGLAGVWPFVGTAPERSPHATPWQLWLPPVVLAAAGLAALADLPWLARWVVDPALAATVPGAEPVKLSLWHGWNVPLALSGATLAIGGGLYASREWLRSAQALPETAPSLAAAWHDRLWEGLLDLATFCTRGLQTGSLSTYVAVTLLTVGGLMIVPLVDRLDLLEKIVWPDFTLPGNWITLAIAAMVLVSAGVLATATSRVAALVALSVVGYGAAALFALYGAPDLAMTQVAAESLILVLLVLVLDRLPQPAQISSTYERLGHATLAGLLGLTITLLILVATVKHDQSRLAWYFTERSVAEGYGRNIVNVILVDFRALDTLGEITVVAVAAIGVRALLRLRPPPDDTPDEPSEDAASEVAPVEGASKDNAPTELAPEASTEETP